MKKSGETHLGCESQVSGEARIRNLGFRCLDLEVDTRVDDKTSHSAVAADIIGPVQQIADNTEIGVIDIHIRRSEIRVIQDIHRINSKFELLRFGDLETLHEVHVKEHGLGSANRCVPETAGLSGLRVYQDDISIRIDNRLV